MAAQKLIYYLIPLIFLILVVMWQFGPKGLFEDMKDAVKGVLGILPKVTIGTEELTGEKPAIPKAHEDAIRKLTDTIKKMRDSPGENCFANYGGLPDLGEEGTLISFQLKEGKTAMLIGGGAGGKQEISYEEIEGFKPCVIAGKTALGADVAGDFYDNFLSEEKKRGGTLRKLVNSIQIKYDGGNKIIHDFGTGGLEDGGWLFKERDGYVCFFPTFKRGTRWGCEAKEDGLDNDCMKKFNELDKCY